MIKDFSNGRLDEIKSFATTNGLTDSLKKLSPDLNDTPKREMKSSSTLISLPCLSILKSSGKGNSSLMEVSYSTVRMTDLEMAVPRHSLFLLTLKEYLIGKSIPESGYEH